MADQREREVAVEELAEEVVRGELLDTHTAAPARIQSYDAATQTATVVLEVQRVFRRRDGTEEAVTVAPIEGVPVVFPRAGGFALTFPVAQGDRCLVVFAERDLSGWMQLGRAGAPPSARHHDYQDAIAIPGLWPSTEALAPAPSTDAVQLRSDDGTAVLEIGPTGGVSVVTTGSITLTRGVNELLAVLSAALDAIATSTVAGTPLSNAAVIAAQKALVDVMRLP